MLLDTIIKYDCSIVIIIISGHTNAAGVQKGRG